MIRHRVLFALCVLCVALSALAAHRWNTATLESTALPLDSTKRASARRPQLTADSIDALAGAVAENDPFRVANAPATVAYSPAADAGVGATAIAMVPKVRPNLVLKGIIGGPPWQAIVDGLPGQTSGSVVRVGMVVDKLTVRSITSDVVLVQGPDTTWKLSLAHPNP